MTSQRIHLQRLMKQRVKAASNKAFGKGQAKEGTVQFQEAYLWVLRGDASTLTACLNYRIRQGTVSTLAIDLPPGAAAANQLCRRQHHR